LWAAIIIFLILFLLETFKIKLYKKKKKKFLQLDSSRQQIPPRFFESNILIEKMPLSKHGYAQILIDMQKFFFCFFFCIDIHTINNYFHE
jgi:hypothetical protein